MSEHRASVRWRGAAANGGRGAGAGGSAASGGSPDADEEFRRGRYSRAHHWEFDGGVTVPASPSPSVVPAPWSDPSAVDPEEAYVAAIASCHMLTFLHLASRAGVVVASYDDAAVGVMAPGPGGVPWVREVRLAPRVVYAGPAPAADREAELHRRAHAECFIANSVRTEIRVVGAG